MSRSYCNLLYHMVFSTKNREPLLSDEIRPRIYDYLGGAIRGEGGIAIEINGTKDHVHILAKLRQDKTVSDILRAIKANSSAWIRKTFKLNKEFRWQMGYGAFTVSQSAVKDVQKYIQNQEEHHKQMTFQEEFTRLLKKHGIDYNEKYLWD